MIKKLLLLAAIFYSIINLAQAPAIQWQKCLGGTSGEGANSIQQTTDGGYIMAGWTQSNDGDVTVNHGGQDVWIVKLSALGALEWQNALGGTSDDEAFSIQQTNDGGYILVGYTLSNNGNVIGNHGNRDSWIVKLSFSGTLEWQKCLGGTGNEEINSIQQTTDEGYILAGWTESNNGDVSSNHGDSDFWVVKLSNTGALEWQKTLGGTVDEKAYNIQQTIDGGYILVGYTDSDNGDITVNHGNTDVWVVKLLSSGVLEWQNTFGGTNYDFGNSIQQINDGGYILGGTTSSNDGNVTGIHGIFSDAWVLKLSSLGSLEWQRTLGGTSGDNCNSIQQTTDGGYILTTYTESIDGDVTGNHGSGDVWVVKLSALGAIEWQNTLGGTGGDVAQTIQQTIDGGYILTGDSNSTDNDVLGNHGNYDGWVVKLGPELATDNFDKKSCIIYPNPAMNTLHIQTNQSIDKITITDSTGKKIKEQDTTSNQIDVQDLQQGMYILQVFSGGNTFEEKFVKE